MAVHHESGSISVPDPLTSKGAQYWLPHVLTEPHEQQHTLRSARLGEMAEQLTPMSSILQATVAGRHGRHWYDEDQDVLRAATAHSPEGTDFHRLAGLEAATSFNNAIQRNQHAAYDLYRLWQMGPQFKNQRIPPRSKNPADVENLVRAYGNGQDLFYPDDYSDASRRGQPLVRAVGEGLNRSKQIHTDDGWKELPLFYVHGTTNKKTGKRAGWHGLAPMATAAINSILHPERYSDPHQALPMGVTADQLKGDSFLRNKLGNQDRATIDTHEGRGLGFRKGDLGRDTPYNFLVGVNRHVAHLLNSGEEYNPHHDHPVYGQGWTAARGQAARWHTMRAIRDRIVNGQTPEQAALGLTAKEVHEGSSFIHLFRHPDYQARIKTMIAEGHLPPTFLGDVKRVEDRWKPSAEDLTAHVGHQDLIPIAHHINKAIGEWARTRGGSSHQANLHEADLFNDHLPEPENPATSF
jgi:hypothetical protein